MSTHKASRTARARRVAWKAWSRRPGYWDKLAVNARWWSIVQCCTRKKIGKSIEGCARLPILNLQIHPSVSLVRLWYQVNYVFEYLPPRSTNAGTQSNSSLLLLPKFIKTWGNSYSPYMSLTPTYVLTVGSRSSKIRHLCKLVVLKCMGVFRWDVRAQEWGCQRLQLHQWWNTIGKDDEHSLEVVNDFEPQLSAER